MPQFISSLSTLETALYSILLAIVLVAAFNWTRFLIDRTRARKLAGVKFPPDDPLVLQAARKARETLDVFVGLHAKFPPGSAVLSLGPLKQDGPSAVAQLLRTQPGGVYVVQKVVKSGNTLSPVGGETSCALDDIVDWIIVVGDKAGTQRVHGAFIRRALFDIAHRDVVKLPKRYYSAFADIDESRALLQNPRPRF